MNKLLLVLKKELREIVRDKKSLTMMLITPLMIPLIIIGVSYLLDYNQNSVDNKYNKVGLTYELSKEEKDVLKNLNLDYKINTEKELKKLYDKKEIYLYIDKQDNNYIIHYDEGNQESASTLVYAEKYLEAVKQTKQIEYLTNNNIDPNNMMNIITVEYKSTQKKEDNYFANYITTYAFIFIIMTITVACTYPATDTTAGEKERGTLETLLTMPVKNKDIIIGKYLGVTISALLTGILGFILSIISFNFINNKIDMFKEINIMPSLAANLITLLILILYSLLISGLAIAIASRSKSYKEGQSALAPLTLIASIPSLILFMLETKTTRLLAAIPFLNYTLIYGDIIKGNFDLINIALMIVSTILSIIIIFVLVIKQYKSEKILFN